MHCTVASLSGRRFQLSPHGIEDVLRSQFCRRMFNPALKLVQKRVVWDGRRVIRLCLAEVVERAGGLPITGGFRLLLQRSKRHQQRQKHRKPHQEQATPSSHTSAALQEAHLLHPEAGDAWRSVAGAVCRRTERWMPACLPRRDATPYGRIN